MTSVSSRPVARLTSPGEIVATVPTLCGFLPCDSVVVLSLRGPRRRLGLTVRLDLPPPDGTEEAAGALAARVQHDGGAAAVIVVFAEHRADQLVRELGGSLAQRGITVNEALHVADGRWTSYGCAAACCPADGTPVPPPGGLLQAEQALDGRAVLASREELVQALSAPAGSRAVLADARLAVAVDAWRALRLASGVATARRTAVERAAVALDLVERGHPVSDEQAAELAVALHDVRVRDEVVTWALDRSGALLALAEQTARVVGPPHDAPVCTLLAWVAYARGDGARANVALDRALATDPTGSLALLLRAALDAGVPPQQVRRTMRDTRRVLRSSRRRR